MQDVGELDYKVLTTLSQLEERIEVDRLAAKAGVDQAQASAVCLVRSERGEIELQEELVHSFRLGKKVQFDREKGLPERQVLKALSENGGEGEMPQASQWSGLEPKEVGQCLRYLKGKGWVEQQGKLLRVLPEGKKALGEGFGADEKLLASLSAESYRTKQELLAQQVPLDEGLKGLKGRSGFVDQREKTLRWVEISKEGRKMVEAGITYTPVVNQLTPELLKQGKWKEVELRPYDVTREVELASPGKRHPLTRIFEKTRRVFLEMGFQEVNSGFVESSFWDFDALFQPQDHPARDMQDTFYISNPPSCGLPSQEIVKAVGETHRDGGETGSVGWRYDWSSEKAKKPVLRTHTTAATIRALADHPQSPGKFFIVGPVFRRETIDYKHLPVFHQVDGIIIDEKANFAQLLGTLKAFYRKMGFEKFQFRPAFFPYTEPSVEIFVWLESKKDWVEMGGAGIFRPEVTEPLGYKGPVLAWGLGLERLAMLSYQLKSIGELYRSRISWLKESAQCQS